MRNYLMRNFLFFFLLIITYNSIGKNYEFFNIKNQLELINSDDSIPIIFVFANNPCCHDCFLKLNKYILGLKKNIQLNFKVFLLLRNEESIVSRKLNKIYFTDYFNCDSVFFSPINSANSTKSNNFIDYFLKYKIKTVPSLLIINKEKEYYIDYRQMFHSDGILPNFEIILEKLTS